MKNELLKRIISSLILIPIVFFSIIKGSYYFYFLLIVAFLTCCYEWHSMSKTKSYYIIGFIFLVISFSSIHELRFNVNDSFLIILFITLVCILTDIGGFAFGKVFKGPKLTKLSPKKTYSGAIGAYLFSLFSIIIIFIFNHQYMKDIISLLLFVLLV